MHEGYSTNPKGYLHKGMHVEMTVDIYEEEMWIWHNVVLFKVSKALYSDFLECLAYLHSYPAT